MYIADSCNKKRGDVRVAQNYRNATLSSLTLGCRTMLAYTRIGATSEHNIVNMGDGYYTFTVTRSHIVAAISASPVPP